MAALSFIPVLILSHNPYPSNAIQIITFVFGLPIFIALLLSLCGLVSFSANVIQYGMDQLHDTPTEDSIPYVHWYVWTTFAGLLIVRLPTGFISTFLFIFVPIALILLGTTLCLRTTGL